MRPSGRDLGELRAITIETGVMSHAEGSCLIRMGHTHVLCTATIEEKPPSFLKGTGQGWVTAEYGMLPRATHTRNRREAAAGKQSGRTQEIQRLIGRSLRAGVDRLAAAGLEAPALPGPHLRGPRALAAGPCGGAHRLRDRARRSMSGRRGGRAVAAEPTTDTNAISR